MSWLVLVSVAGLSSACISKGDTNIGTDRDKTERETDATDTEATATGESDDALTEGDDSGEGDTLAESEPTEEPAESQPSDSEPPEPGETGPSASEPNETDPLEETSSEPPESTDSALAPEETEPEIEPAELVACEQDLTPGRGEVVQLTDSTATKRGLRAVAGPDGVLLSWQVVGASKVEAGYQAFDNDLSPLYDVMKIADIEDVDASGVVSTWDAVNEQYALAFGHAHTARLSLLDGDGTASEPVDTTLPTGGTVKLASSEGLLHVSALQGAAGCPGAQYYQARIFDPLTEMVTTPSNGPMCHVNLLDVFDAGEGNVGILIQPTYQLLSLHYVSITDPTAAGSNVSLSPFDVSQGAVARAVGDKVIGVNKVAGGVKYARFAADGMIAGSASDISVSGTPVGIAATEDVVGVALEDAANVRFFARGMDGKSYHPHGVVAAQKGLVEPQLLVVDGQFTVFFRAEDDAGDSQIYATKVMCKPE